LNQLVQLTSSNARVPAIEQRQYEGVGEPCLPIMPSERSADEDRRAK